MDRGETMREVIARELLERYLRAKGLARPAGWNDRDTLSWLASKEGRDSAEVFASLGLCAAADTLIAEHRGYAAASVEMAGAPWLARVASSMATFAFAIARSLLGRAGVNPDRWIELAERGNAQGTSSRTSPEPGGHLSSGASMPAHHPPATEQASVRDGVAPPLGEVRRPDTASKTPEEIAAELVPNDGLAVRLDDCIAFLAFESGDAQARIEARGIIARLVQRVREEPVSRAVAELLKVGAQPMPCGHKVEDLIGGAGAVTKCGACLAARQKARSATEEPFAHLEALSKLANRAPCPHRERGVACPKCEQFDPPDRHDEGQ